jgi:Kdo2-lipid IVA lauroyltransferase/acyltransferase
MRNLKYAFPDKTEVERKRIAVKFYKYIADLMVETIWCFSLTRKRITKRLTVKNPELINSYFDAGRSVILILSHYSSYELVLSSLNLFVKHQVATIYTPLTNERFDKYFYRMRTVFDSEMIPKKDFSKSMAAGHDMPRAIIFGTDQSPASRRNLYWTKFLNMETAVAFGTEKYAKKYNLPVVYTWLNKVRKGYYAVEFEIVVENPLDEPEGRITEKHVQFLERQILGQPEFWLWSHKRWKFNETP